MKGYCINKIISLKSSKAMDLSSLLTSLEPEKTDSNTVENYQKTKKTDAKTSKNHKKDSFLSQEDHDHDHQDGHEQEIFSIKLKRNSSLSSSSASVLFKKAFSIKRSSSVCERYCRIHDQSIRSPSHGHDHDNVYGDDDHDGDLDTKTITSIRKKKSGRAKFFNACKRLLGR